MNDMCDCPKCGGEGFVREFTDDGYTVDVSEWKCPVCKGTGGVDCAIVDFARELRAENQVLRNEIDKLIREVRNETRT